MNTLYKLLGASLLGLSLTACNSSNDDGNGMAAIDDPANSVGQVFANDAAGDAIEIGDADALAADLDRVFGSAEPVAVEEGDSIDDVRQRAQGS